MKVHDGFLTKFNAVWKGSKGRILGHLRSPAMLSQDYDYETGDYDKDKYQKNVCEEDEQDLLEAIYVTGHSLGGAMAFVAALALVGDPLWKKVRGVYTYGQPMVIDSREEEKFHKLIGSAVYRHVYYNDIVPHLPPLSTSLFDHVGEAYRWRPRGWKLQKRHWLIFYPEGA
jgi:hypothetical protein